MSTLFARLLKDNAETCKILGWKPSCFFQEP